MLYRHNFDLSVYFIADPSVCQGRMVEDVIAAAVRGGVTMVQLRNKVDDLSVVERQALAIQGFLADSNVPFILNDHVELAAKIDADGVHIGQDDISAAQARDIIGADKILGLTAFTRVHYDALDPNIVDYIGTGPFYSTLTKPDKLVMGADAFSLLVDTAPVGVVGIGGITPDNAADVIVCGAQGVAMMRSISEAENVEGAARKFVNVVKGADDANT